MADGSYGDNKNSNKALLRTSLTRRRRGLTFGQENDMKYGGARFVYGLSGTILILIAAWILLRPFAGRDSASCIVVPMGIVLIFASVPFALGVCCLCRCRYWNSEAIRMKQRPEQANAAYRR